MLYVTFGLKFDIYFKILCENCNLNQQKTTTWKMQSLEWTLTLVQLALFFMLSPKIPSFKQHIHTILHTFMQFFCMFLKIRFYFLCFKVDNFVFSICNVYFCGLLLYVCTLLSKPCCAHPKNIVFEYFMCHLMVKLLFQQLVGVLATQFNSFLATIVS